jgi:hypothetical protein
VQLLRYMTYAFYTRANENRALEYLRRDKGFCGE